MHIDTIQNIDPGLPDLEELNHILCHEASIRWQAVGQVL